MDTGELKRIYNNQRLLYVNKQKINKSKSNKEEYFQQGYNWIYYKAARELSENALKVFLYLNGLAPTQGFDWAMSAKDVESCVGVKRSTYKRVLTELMAKDYIFDCGYHDGISMFLFSNDGKATDFITSCRSDLS